MSAAREDTTWDALVPVEVTTCSVELPEAVVGFRALTACEAAAVRGASSRRVHQFTAGRHCAALALDRLGWPPAGLPRGVRGEPRWPEGIAGSITHDDGHAAAAVCRVGRVRAVGIDVQRSRAISPGVARRVCRPAELVAATELLGGLGEAPRVLVSPETLLFSVKESVYKAWYPLTRLPLGFEDVEVLFDQETGGFGVGFCTERARVVATPLGTWRGRFDVKGWRVRTALVVERHAGEVRLQSGLRPVGRSGNV